MGCDRLNARNETPNQQYAKSTVKWLCCFLIPQAFQSELTIETFWTSQPDLMTLQIKCCWCCCHCFSAMPTWVTLIWIINANTTACSWINNDTLRHEWRPLSVSGLSRGAFSQKFSHVSVIQNKYPHLNPQIAAVAALIDCGSRTQINL